MSRLRFPTLVLFCILITATLVAAGEGMWPVYSLDKLNFDSLKVMGLNLGPTDIYNPVGGGLADAVVQLGATGSFVSPDGLILTNHHVAYGAIQEQSTTDNNFLRDGFYAATRDAELPAVGYKAYITLGIEDVTRRVLAGVKDNMPDLARYEVIDKNIKKIIRTAETGKDVKCKVASMFGGKQYMLYTQFELKDIRIVHVPPEAIGNFGGETDNWMWPRHTGDFSFLRAYVAPDGKSADYAKENIPYKPKVWLRVKTEGFREGDFAMTLGFPGSTERYISSHDLEYQINAYYPVSIGSMEDQIRILNQSGEKDPEVALRLASDLKGIYNGLKNSYGTIEGFTKGRILDRKREEERQLIEFLEKNPELNKKYGKVLPELHVLLEEHEKTYEHDYYLGRMGWGCDYLRLANSVYRWAVEREKPDMERERGYQERDLAGARDRLKNAQTNLVPQADKEILKYFLTKAIELPPSQRIAAIDQMVAEQGDNKYKYIDQLVEEMYAQSKVGDLDRRMAMFDMTREQLEQLNDPMINLAKALHPELEQNRLRSRSFSGALSRLTPKLVLAYAEFRGREGYPDANGTMRLSCGQVKGYQPRNGITYHYLTGLTGVMEKETGKGEFIVPAELKQVFDMKDLGRWVDPVINDVPVDFLSTNDITGGNSGSPVIDGDGRLIGCAFDGNWEGVASDYLFAPEVTRTISVDIRYVLFLLDRVYHYEELLRELGVEKAS